jgi:predicted Rdx family selenoprotein
LIIVLERARLVWTSLAAKFTECTWSLEASFLNLRIKTQFLERLQSVSVVDGTTHTQKDDVEINGCSLENVAEVFVLFLCNV